MIKRTKREISASSLISGKMATPQDSAAVPAIDNRYLDKQSRTIGTYGLETMRKLISFRILIVGCNGIGVETAKNLSLAGVKSITFFDNIIPQPKDMGANFCLTEAMLQENQASLVKAGRATLSQHLIAELNPYCNVEVVHELTEEIVRHHKAMIITSCEILPLSELARWNAFCRTIEPQVSFILAMQGGPIASIFVDYGNSFTTHDLDGRTMLQKRILEVVDKVDGGKYDYTRIRFCTPEGQMAGSLCDYTRLQFLGVKGLISSTEGSINGKIFNAVVSPKDSPNTVRIYPSLQFQGYSPYETGGFIQELKIPKTFHYRDLLSSLESPGQFIPVSPMMDNTEESFVHLIIQGILLFTERYKGRLPDLHNVIDANSLSAIISEINAANALRNQGISDLHHSDDSSYPASAEEMGQFPEGLYQNPEFPSRPVSTVLSKCISLDDLPNSLIFLIGMLWKVELQPLATFIGALVAQEVVKITGKYTPIHQWFHFNVSSLLDEKTDYTSPEYAVDGSGRYDHIIAMFGRQFHAHLSNLKIFMVGCGALGCENAKNFALCGVGCGSNGELVITDNDRIELSNLSRQFLFREENIGQMKSTAAAKRMQSINSSCRVEARQDYISKATESIYHDCFWKSLDVVVNALDNMPTRLYVDQRCVEFHKVLVEAGTMGTGGNVDIIIPGKTTSYADGGGADQTGGIPMCTLRNFPYLYEHCIEWGRAQFDELFTLPLQAAKKLLENPSKFAEEMLSDISLAHSDGEKRSVIERHLSSLHDLQRSLAMLSNPPTMHTCVMLAWKVFYDLFRDRILNLQRAFPKDAVKRNGAKFWSGHRVYPQALIVDREHFSKYPDILDFLAACANLYASMLGIHPAKPPPQFNDEKNPWMKEFRTHDWILSEIQSFEQPEFLPQFVGNLDDDTLDGLMDVPLPTLEEASETLTSSLRQVTSAAQMLKYDASKLSPLDFEKDDDQNFHIDFIAAAGNLRAINYNIEPQDRLKVKIVAGKIIPAIATTTSAVTGLALIELFKVINNREIDALRNGMIDLGTNNYVLFERDPPIRHRRETITTYLPENDYTYKKMIICVPEGFTKYDTIDIACTKTTTVAEFADALTRRLNELFSNESSSSVLEIMGIGIGTGLIWNGSQKAPNFLRPLLQLIESQLCSENGDGPKIPFWQNREQFSELMVHVELDNSDYDVDEVEVLTAPIRLLIS